MIPAPRITPSIVPPTPVVLTLYVYHYMVIEEPIGALLNYIPIAWFHSPHQWLVDLPLTIALAALSWHLFESPILSFKTRFAYTPPARDLGPLAPSM